MDGLRLQQCRDCVCDCDSAANVAARPAKFEEGSLYFFGFRLCLFIVVLPPFNILHVSFSFCCCSCCCCCYALSRIYTYAHTYGCMYACMFVHICTYVHMGQNLQFEMRSFLLFPVFICSLLLLFLHPCFLLFRVK